MRSAVRATGRSVAGFLFELSGPHRSERGNLRLGVVLCAVAGAVNAGGFLAVARYTSHMTGIVSEFADNLVLGHGGAALAALMAVITFVLGSISTTVLIHWARRKALVSRYAIPLMVEALLLLVFGLLGASLHWAADVIVPATVLLLCFIMGLQNAMVTKISRAQIRTTHLTGILTDIGIELGRLLYWNRHPQVDPSLRVQADRKRLAIHIALFTAFVQGALIGAAAFKSLGYAATVPLALLLAALAAAPLAEDCRRRWGARS